MSVQYCTDISEFWYVCTILYRYIRILIYLYNIAQICQNYDKQAQKSMLFPSISGIHDNLWTWWVFGKTFWSALNQRAGSQRFSFRVFHHDRILQVRFKTRPWATVFQYVLSCLNKIVISRPSSSIESMPKQKPKGRNASCEATMIDTNDDNGKYTYYKGIQIYRRADPCPLHTWLDACVYTQIRKLRLSTSLDSQEKYCKSSTCAKVHSGPSKSRMELPQIITHTWHCGSKVLWRKREKRPIWKSLKTGENRWPPLKPGENPLKHSENRWKRFWHPKPKSLRYFPCAKKLPILKSVKSTRWLKNETHCPSWLHQLHP